MRLHQIWYYSKNSFFNYVRTQNLTMEHACDLLLEPLFKIVDKYTIVLGQVSAIKINMKN